jgi:hypothetical protein
MRREYRYIIAGTMRFRKTVVICELHGELDLFLFPDAETEHADCVNRDYLFPIATMSAKGNQAKSENFQQRFVPDTRLGLKYDRRRKRDTPRRQWERNYRREARRRVAGR